MWCKEAPDAAWMRMAGVYGLLRLRQMLRLLREVGFVRSLLLLLLGSGHFGFWSRQTMDGLSLRLQQAGCFIVRTSAGTSLFFLCI